ncbi:ABC transport system permease protein [Candidatus Kinetoplastibacterium blastocrithidii TCC012E]|uniref:Intermembrane phospholipid transport system permease protein MlaE n=1 Tax=Candidatus Kinetoplastidibacterium blastocrithidiae TCC012E TaxID=1208922 RepID=M1M2R2_9PROT|nr:lipid asymmetry maintenance ABC transporter permease subunit MlaE [Candidatus Kinetoplastibacterium blastocrithidii]AFZ83386.1 ABC transport system permease protein [Candidatus Kinetoplastibacterium blastocrithidii (ex Strigomonas culicis)]AGF49484.1 ABC transport system permease protein [Candidatus Kinetoplastibacterium blastocrithidii TCC012E]
MIQLNNILNRVYEFTLNTGRLCCLLCKIVIRSDLTNKRRSLVVDQIYLIGNNSVLIISISGLFVGFVLGLQGYLMLSKFSAEDTLGLMVTVSLTRELGPVVTALLFAGRAGTSMTAEIGLMKAGEQILAMEIMAIDPVERILAPRFWAGILSMPVLAIIFSTTGIIGSWLVGAIVVGIDSGLFWSQIQCGFDIYSDIVCGTIFKSLVFGLSTVAISLNEGWQCNPTPDGISRAITRTVVNGSLTVFLLDFFMTSILFVN